MKLHDHPDLHLPLLIRQHIFVIRFRHDSAFLARPTGVTFFLRCKNENKFEAILQNTMRSKELPTNSILNRTNEIICINKMNFQRRKPLSYRFFIREIFNLLIVIIAANSDLN